MNSPVVLSPATPLTLPTLLDAMRAAAADGVLPASLVAPASSDLTHALAWQLAQRPDVGSERQALTLLEPPAASPQVPVDVRALLHGTVAAARARAKSAGHRRPGNAAGRVARVLAHLTPWVASTRRDATPVGDGATTVFHDLAARILAVVPDDEPPRAARRRQQVAWNLRALGRKAATVGVTTLADLPRDYEALVAALEHWGVDRRKRAGAVHTLRAASRLLATDSDAPALPTWAAPARGASRDALIASRLPRLDRELTAWERGSRMAVGTRDPRVRDRTAHRKLRRSTSSAQRSSVRQWAEALVTLVDAGHLDCPVALADVGLEALWTVSLTARVRPVAIGETDPFADERARRLGSADSKVVVKRPLAVAVIHAALDHGLWDRARRDPETRRWPKHAAQMAFRLWAVAERYALGVYVDEEAEPLLAMQATWRSVRPACKEALLESCRHRNPKAIVARVTLPHVVCLVLPWWTQHRLPASKAAWLAAGRAAHRSAAAAHRARAALRAYREDLAQYQALVTFVADPWRIGNAMHARVARELDFDLKWGDDGELLEVIKVTSRYPGDADRDLPEVTTKTGAAREVWRWSNSILDPRWFAEVLRQLWLPNLVAAGVVPPETTLADAVTAGRYAWLANATPRSSAPVVVEGAYRDASSVAERFGDALLKGLRAMGVTPLPSSAAAASREGYGWQFTPHTVRTLWATYWFGVRREAGPVRPESTERHDGVQVACSATGDAPQTLARHYAAVEKLVLEQMRRPVDSWEHPRAFDALMDRTWFEGNEVDWQRQWRDPAFRRLLPPSLAAVGPDAPESRRRHAPRRWNRARVAAVA